MNRSITNALGKHLVGKKVWVITGTIDTKGGPELDLMTERAFTKEEAWAQAEHHAAGTGFTPEKIEERTW